jgi:hypothetical protein
VLIISWLLMPRQQLWKPFIIVASYVFYAACELALLPAARGDHARQPAVRGADPSRADRARAASG